MYQQPPNCFIVWYFRAASPGRTSCFVPVYVSHYGIKTARRHQLSAQEVVVEKCTTVGSYNRTLGKLLGRKRGDTSQGPKRSRRYHKRLASAKFRFPARDETFGAKVHERENSGGFKQPRFYYYDHFPPRHATPATLVLTTLVCWSFGPRPFLLALLFLTDHPHRRIGDTSCTEPPCIFVSSLAV